jgi:hypothetical protein
MKGTDILMVHIYSKSLFIRHALGMRCADRLILPLERTVTYGMQF